MRTRAPRNAGSIVSTSTTVSPGWSDREACFPLRPRLPTGLMVRTPRALAASRSASSSEEPSRDTDPYRAVSVTNNCDYCMASHTASARAKGMTDAQLNELYAVVGLANMTNRLANGYKVPVDAAYKDPA